MAQGTMKAPSIRETFTTTFSTSQYTGWYYADYTPSHSVDDIESVIIRSTTENRPAFAQIVGTGIRIWGQVSGGTVRGYAYFRQ